MHSCLFVISKVYQLKMAFTIEKEEKGREKKIIFCHKIKHISYTKIDFLKKKPKMFVTKN